MYRYSTAARRAVRRRWRLAVMRAARRQRRRRRRWRCSRRSRSRVDDRTGVIAIEASDPVPYVASQPDPRTFVVELRDVVARGFADQFTADPRNPIAAVQVESAHGGRRRQRRARAHDADAADAAARAQLAQRHLRRGRPRSIARSPAPARISLAGPAATIRDVRVHAARRRPRRSRCSAPAALRRHQRRGSRRTARRGWCIDLPNVTSAVPAVDAGRAGPGRSASASASTRASPLMTAGDRWTCRAPRAYRLESSAGRQRPDGRLRRAGRRAGRRRCSRRRRAGRGRAGAAAPAARRRHGAAAPPPAPPAARRRRGRRPPARQASPARRRRRATPAIRSASTSRAPTCARCCAPSPRSAA